MFKNKKFVVLLLCLVILAQSTTAFAVSFSDVTKDNRSGWAYDYIMELANKGIINGYEDGTFKPENNVSYLETLKLLYGVMNPSSTEIAESLSKYKSFISSMNTPEWAYETVAVSLNRGVVTESEYRAAANANLIQLGTTKPISRYDVAIFMARALELQPKANPNLTYDDKNEIDNNAAKLIGALIDTGVLHKDGRDGKFLPKSPIKRSEMAKMVKYAYDWTITHPLTGGVKEQTESGTVISYNPIGEKNYLVYKNKSGNTVSALLDSGTAIKDKDNKSLTLKDVFNFEGAEVVVVYKYINDERHATSVKFTSSADVTDGEYTFKSFRTVGNRYYLTVVDRAGNKIEKESRNSTAKNGNSSIFIQDIKPDAKLDLKFDGSNLISEVKLAKPQTGEYYVKEISTRGSYYSITVYPVDRGAERTYRLYSNNPTVVNGTTNSKFTDIKPGDVVDLKFELQDLVNRVVIYPSSVVIEGSYTYETHYSDRIYVNDNRTNKGRYFDLDKDVRLVNFRSLSELKYGDQIELEIDRFDVVTKIKLTEYRSDYRRDEQKVKFETSRDKLVIKEIGTGKVLDHIEGKYIDSVEILINGRRARFDDLPSKGIGYAKFNDEKLVVQLDYDGYYNKDYDRDYYNTTKRAIVVSSNPSKRFVGLSIDGYYYESKDELSEYQIRVLNLKVGDRVDVEFDRFGKIRDIKK